MTTIYVQPNVMPARTPAELLAQAREGLNSSTDHAAACLAALRGGAAVIAARAEPDRKYGKRITNSWVLLAMVAPELGEWAAFFASPDQVSFEHYRVETGRFLAVVAELLGRDHDLTVPENPFLPAGHCPSTGPADTEEGATTR